MVSDTSGTESSNPASSSKESCEIAFARPCIAAKFDLRINHTSFHRPVPFQRYEILRQIQTIGVRSGISSPNAGI